MKLARVLRHPLAPPVLVVVVLPLAALLAPADQRNGWIALLALVGGPLAAVASVLAVRRALARIEVPDGAPEASYQEVVLTRLLRWALALVAILGPLTLWSAAFIGSAQTQDPASPPPPVPAYQVVFLAVLPLFLLGVVWRLWRDVVSMRRRRALGLAPLPPERSTWTGDARLDALVGRRLRWTNRLAWMVGFASALGFLSPGHALLAQLAKVNEAILRGEFWRLATASFVHGELLALVVSAMAFFAVAPLVEVLLGPGWLVAVFVAGGIAATGASFAFVPANYMGSTGSVAALTGLLLFVAVRQLHRLPPATVRRIGLHGLAALLIVAFAGVLLPSADTAAHLGGFVFGAAAGLVASPSPAVRSAMERARQEALAAVA